MPDLNQLRSIVAQQKKLVAELEQEATVLMNADLTKENEALKKELQESKRSLAEQSQKLKTTREQNASLKNALFEQVYSEKTRILDRASTKNDIYFKAEVRGELNRLSQLDRRLQDKAKQLKEQLKKYDSDQFSELFGKLDELTAQANAALIQAKVEAETSSGAYTASSKEQFEALKSEQITDEVVEAVGKKNNLEAFVGGNLINKAGIVFLILGIITVSQLTFMYLPETFRAIIMFAISGVFLIGGEFLNRKKANIFSLGITSIGVAGLYISLSVSYFVFEIVAMIPALLLCILITVGAFVLSRRYNSQTIASFALVGGYIPLISISDNLVLIYSAMVYFIVLNLLALSMSFYKNWKISMFVGFILNVFGTLYIVMSLSNLSLRFGWNNASPEMFIAIAYILLAFAVYTCIPIISNHRTKIPFRRSDVVILSLNTVLSALILYGTLMMFGLDALTGIMAIVFAVIYVGLGRFMERFFAVEKRTTALFYITGLTFVVLVIPLQFGVEWLSLGWLAQAVSLICYGIVAGEKRFKKAGIIIGGLCLIAFLLFDVPFHTDALFPYKYLAITVGSIAVLAALAYKKSLAHIGEKVYKYVVIGNAWFYSMYLVSRFDYFLHTQMQGVPLNPDFLLSAMTITVTFLFVAIVPRVPLLMDQGVKIMMIGISILGILALWGTNHAFSIVYGEASIGVMITATAILIALCALAILALRNVFMFFVLEKGLSVEWLPFGLSAFFLITLTQNLVTQYHLAITSMVISIVFVAAAFAWIIYGFVKRFAFMRRFGLGLSVVAVAKLFLIDLPDLTPAYRIVSYFAFGITLLGISFVYQYFSKRLAPKIQEEDENVDESI